MAEAALPLFLRRMPKARDAPGFDPVAFPAVAAEEPTVNVRMTSRAHQATAQQCVVHLRDISRDSSVLYVALQAMHLGLVKPNLRCQEGDVAERVALQAHVIGYPPPRPVAKVALIDLLMEDAQIPRHRRLLVQKEPNAKGHGHCDGHDISDLHGTHLRP